MNILVSYAPLPSHVSEHPVMHIHAKLRPRLLSVMCMASYIIRVTLACLTDFAATMLSLVVGLSSVGVPVPGILASLPPHSSSTASANAMNKSTWKIL